MTFEMNNRKWEIIEKNQKEMKQSVSEHGDVPDDGRYFGLTYTDDQKIFIDKDICQEQKKANINARTYALLYSMLCIKYYK